MKIGFIGAGHVGFSLSKWINMKHNCVLGIYSRNIDDSIECAKFSISEYYKSLKDMVLNCDTLFLTVNDDSIKNVVDELISLNVKNKILIHTSGSLSSSVFKELNNDNDCYSIHPIYAFNNKYESYKGLDDIYFTLEGSSNHLDEIKNIFNNKIVVIDKDKKKKYHLACSMISNMVCGIVDIAEDMYKDIGIDDSNIYMPLFMNNINNILNVGPLNSLTGPIIRNDIETVKGHIDNLKNNELLVYKYLGLHLIEMSEKRNNNDYSKMKKLLEEI